MDDSSEIFGSFEIGYAGTFKKVSNMKIAIAAVNTSIKKIVSIEAIVSNAPLSIGEISMISA
jgi:hypothetical protein